MEERPLCATLDRRIRLKCIVLGAAGAGKTSILRRYFYGAFEYTRPKSTIGADFYSKRVNNPVQLSALSAGARSGPLDDSSRSLKSSDSESRDIQISLRSIRSERSRSDRSPRRSRRRRMEWSPSIAGEPFVNLQMWDTAGRERMGSDKSSGLSSGLGDAFFRHADVAMLVYDATSSRSFTQLIKWHSELMERISYLRDGSVARVRPRFPVLVVANKVDRLRTSGMARRRRPRVVPQRDVMGLGGNFKGKDHRYEYSVSSSPSSSDLGKRGGEKAGSKEGGGGTRHHSSLSYALTDTTWSTDYSYLTSVIKSEDASFPDRDMVVLWCRRNGLKHVEVSSFDGEKICSTDVLPWPHVAFFCDGVLLGADRFGVDKPFWVECDIYSIHPQCVVVFLWNEIGHGSGTGIDAAIDAVVMLGLEYLNKLRQMDSSQAENAWNNKIQGGESLDLHKRYAPKEKAACCWGLIPCL